MGKQAFLDQVTINEEDIQGDILVGLQKKAEVFVFFNIFDSDDFKTGLRTLIPQLATTKQTRETEIWHTGDPVKVNIAFSPAGLEKLGVAVPEDADPSFLNGMKAEADAVLGDDVEADWLPEYKTEIFDGILLVAAFDQDRVKALSLAKSKVDQIKHLFGATARGVDVLFEAHREEGQLNAAAEGHEVFGFADGVSQPAVKGLHRHMADEDQSFAGQDIVKLGDFILGPYDKELDQPDGTPGKATPPAAWMENGSYLVFRRLTQHVDTFKEYTEQNFSGFADDAKQFAARLIGRWQDGSPIARDPLAPNSDHDETQADENNDFEFGIAKVGQKRCPFNAHIRRVYPRSDIQSGTGNAEARRILRAGIAFDKTESTPGDLGLLFVCYQSSIVEKFQFIQSSWANADFIDFDPKYTGDQARLMPPKPGIDLIIGQAATRSADWTVEKDVTPFKVLNNVPKFVTATGGGYFFSPSLSGLREIVGPA